MIKKIFMLLVLIQVAFPVLAEEGVFIYNDNGKRDPFLPLVSPSGAFLNYDSDFQIVDLSLEGIMEDASGNLAIINGRIVKEGEAVGNFQVGKITSKTVSLLKEGQSFILKLKKGGE